MRLGLGGLGWDSLGLIGILTLLGFDWGEAWVLFWTRGLKLVSVSDLTANDNKNSM